jgi:hypothetical protein
MQVAVAVGRTTVLVGQGAMVVAVMVLETAHLQLRVLQTEVVALALPGIPHL